MGRSLKFSAFPSALSARDCITPCSTSAPFSIPGFRLMKPELLQSLLLDRALGELSPEATALLDEYLACHPDAARCASELDDTLAAARAATRVHSGLPPAP